ncbi:MAG TPA: glycosyltransferase family 39 protein [Roseiflexaceae bacterium]
MPMTPRRSLVALGGIALIAHAGLLAPLPADWRGAAALLLLALPGILLALALFGHEGDPPTLIFLGLCGGVALPTLLLLALHAVPGPLLWWLALPACDALSLLAGWALLRQREATTDTGPARRWHPYPALGLVLLLGAALRLLFLGSSEFQGDEARALILALDVVGGRDNILLLHKKGPVEVLVPAAPLALTGQIDEWTARLPFALAGVGILLGGYVLARAMFDDDAEPRSGAAVGLIAATILAVDGFLIGFARIVQYQSVLVLMTLGALWCAWRFYAGAARPQRYLVCAAAMAAVGLLSHYDGVFALPALGWLVLAGGRRRGWRAAEWLRGLAAPLLVGAGLTASFYVPFMLDEHFSTTVRYLQGRADGGLSERLFNNLPDYYLLATVYNTTFQVHWLGWALAAGMLAWLVLYVRPCALGWALAALLLLGCLVLVREPWRFDLDGAGNWAILAFGLPLAGLALSPATPPALRTLVLWFGAPFLAEAFLIARPFTHFYGMDPPAALLIGLAAVRLAQWLVARRLRWLTAPLALAGAGLLALAAPYMYIVFVRPTPEYQGVFPAARPAIYRASYGDQLPGRSGYFGFPHRSGWKVIGDLYQQGALRGDYSSNEEEPITRWYTRSADRCEREPAYYFVATRPNDPNKIPLDAIRQRYHLLGSVLVDGAKTIEIYGRQPAALPAATFALDDSRAAFDQAPLLDQAALPVRFVVEPRPYPPTPWQRSLLLEEGGLDYQRLRPGQATTFWFHWLVTGPLAPDDRMVVDMLDGRGQTVASASPLCNEELSPKWAAGKRLNMSFTLAADTSLPPGQYTVVVGLRDGGTGAPLPLKSGAAALPIAALTVTGR